MIFANSRPYTKQVHVAWFCDLRPAACEQRAHKGAHDLRPATCGRLWRPSCVGAVLKAFLARQVPTNGRRKTVAKTDSSGWRPAANNRPYTQRANVAWFCELRTATCDLRAHKGACGLRPAVCLGLRCRCAASDSNRQRRFGKPSARSGTPFGRPLRNRIQAIINNPRPVASCVGAVLKGGPPRTIGHILSWSMWHGFAACDLRPARP